MESNARITDQILVFRCQMGDALAFEALVTRHHAALLYFARRLLGSADEADDVMQDVWLVVYRQLPRLRDTGAITVWLYRIVRASAIDRLRRRRNVDPLPDDLPAEADEEDREPAFSATDAGRMHLALEKLTAAHREVLVLRFLEQMEYEQIAQVVGCNVGTVRSRLHYAKPAMRRAMEELGHES